MANKCLITIIMFLICVSHAVASDRFIKKLQTPSGQTVVISEGDLEARSIGSFSIRLYQAAQTGGETTFFTSGIISARDGYVEKVVLSDINNDSRPEIIVIVRSAGTGGYLSAHGFEMGSDGSINLISMVEGLQPDKDPILSLKKSKVK